MNVLLIPTVALKALGVIIGGAVICVVVIGERASARVEQAIA
jgi:hypothetical protein